MQLERPTAAINKVTKTRLFYIFSPFKSHKMEPLTCLGAPENDQSGAQPFWLQLESSVSVYRNAPLWTIRKDLSIQGVCKSTSHHVNHQLESYASVALAHLHQRAEKACCNVCKDLSKRLNLAADVLPVSSDVGGHHAMILTS